MTRGWWNNGHRPRVPGHFRRSQRSISGLFARRIDEVEHRLRDEADFVREAPSPILRRRTLEAISRTPRLRRRRQFQSPVRPALWGALAATIVVAFGMHFSQSGVTPSPEDATDYYVMNGHGSPSSRGLSIGGPNTGTGAHAKLQAEFNAFANETQRAAQALLDKFPFTPDADETRDGGKHP